VYRRILDAISPDAEDYDDHDDIDSVESASIIISSDGRPASALSGTRVKDYLLYRQNLEPLVELEGRLIQMLSSSDEDEATHLGPAPPGWEGYANGNGDTNKSNGYPEVASTNGRPAPTIWIPQMKQSHSTPVTPSPAGNGQLPSPTGTSSAKSHTEVSVHTTTNWKKAFALGGKSRSPKSAHSGEIAGWWEDPDDPVHALNACAPVMLQLWRDDTVRERLAEKRLRLEESSGL
jgi:hypothetical protein